MRIHVATIVLILFLGLPSCADADLPDETEFSHLVAQLTVEGAKRSGRMVDGSESPKTVVLDRHYLSEKPEHLERVLAEHLSSADVRWERTDLSGDPANLAGDWDRTGRRPINRTHVLLGLSVEGDGANRTAQWSYTCGPLCGYGEKVSFHWDGDAWRHDVAAVIRY